MDISIKNITELKAEIARLKILEGEQRIAIKARFSSPSALFHTIVSIFPSSPEGLKQGGFFSQDIFSLLSKILLPLALNKTLFRKSNFIVKALVGFLSQKASLFINEDSLMAVWNKVKTLFENKKPLDYGIPPESETS